MAASPAPRNSPSPKERGLQIIEQIKRIGFPNKGNIDALKKLISELSSLVPYFKPDDKIVTDQLEKTLHKIEAMLKEEGDIPIRLYTILNKSLIVLETALRASF